MTTQQQIKSNELCRLLEWDTNFFRRRIARIIPSQLTTEDIAKIQKWSQANLVDCLYFACDASDENSARVAEENQFRLTDVRITFELTKFPVTSNKIVSEREIRRAKSEDVLQLKEIARRSHLDSRYYFDSNFPRELCDRLYEVWIERSCNGYADAVFVAELDSKVCGYITCHLKEHSEGQIGLIALDESAQGKGLGQKLFTATLDFFQSRNIERITVVTQGRNIRAQRFYQRSDFVSCSLELYYHWWINSPKSELP